MIRLALYCEGKTLFYKVSAIGSEHMLIAYCAWIFDRSVSDNKADNAGAKYYECDHTDKQGAGQGDTHILGYHAAFHALSIYGRAGGNNLLHANQVVSRIFRKLVCSPWRE